MIVLGLLLPWELPGIGPIASLGADQHLALSQADGNGVELPVRVGTAGHVSEHIVLAAIGKSSLQAAHNIVTVLKGRATRGACDFGESIAGPLAF